MATQKEGRSSHREPAAAGVRDFLARVRIVDDSVDGDALTSEGGRAELEQYVHLHRRSTELSLAMLGRHMPDLRAPRVLELGGAPYFFSALVRDAYAADLVAVNVEAGAWPGEPASRERSTVTLSVPRRDRSRAADRRSAANPRSAEENDRGRAPNAARAEGADADAAPAGGGASTSDVDAAAELIEIDVRIFNIEKDPFPFGDHTFDVVLCMEVLEHLGYSPSHMLGEAHRVLRPDGLLFVTVPNFINIKRTVSMLLNRRCQYPYSGYGIYGRHQREYAPAEVRDLLEANHFRVAELRTANVWPTFRGSAWVGVGNAALNALSRLPLPWIENKREMIFCAARPFGDPIAAYPAWLYHHRHLYPDPPNGVRKVVSD